MTHLILYNRNEKCFTLRVKVYKGGTLDMFARRPKSYYTKEGYKQIYKPSSPMARSNGFVPEHRDVASRIKGRPLRSNEVVHHRDGNKRNNRPSNLQVMSRRKHWYVHNGKR